MERWNGSTSEERRSKVVEFLSYVLLFGVFFLFYLGVFVLTRLVFG